MSLFKMASLSMSLSVAQWIERPLYVPRTAKGSNFFAILTNITSCSAQEMDFLSFLLQISSI